MIIDLSEFNTVTDWAKVKTQVEAVIIRMGRRDSTSGAIVYDKKYAQHLQGAIAAMIPYSFYFFTTATNAAEGIQEAQWVAAEIKRIGFNPAFLPVPVFVDSEKVSGHGRSDNISKGARTQALSAFCNTLQTAGIPAGIYASTNWLNTQLDMAQLPFSIWVAQYANACTYTGSYILWQYSSKGQLNGISGYVDCSKRYTAPVTQTTTTQAATQTQTETKKETTTEATVSEASLLIATAKNEVGYCEKRSNANLDDKTANAGSNNYTKYARDMAAASGETGIYANGYAWCDTFVDWCFMKTFGTTRAKELLGGWSAYTPTSSGYYKNRKQWYTSPKAGDQIFFKNTYNTICHTGIVTAVDDNKVYTVEGNTSGSTGLVANGGAVCEKSYTKNNTKIAGYGRPAYANTNVSSTGATTTTAQTQTTQNATNTTNTPAAAKGYNKNIAGTYTVTASKLNMRKNAGTNYAIIAVLSKGNRVNCYGYYSTDTNGTKWYFVQVGTYTGYVSSQYLSKN